MKETDRLHLSLSEWPRQASREKTRQAMAQVYHRNRWPEMPLNPLVQALQRVAELEATVGNRQQWNEQWGNTWQQWGENWQR